MVITTKQSTVKPPIEDSLIKDTIRKKVYFNDAFFTPNYNSEYSQSLRRGHLPN